MRIVQPVPAIGLADRDKLLYCPNCNESDKVVVRCNLRWLIEDGKPVIDVDYIELFLGYLELAIYYPHILDRETADVQITLNLAPFILRNFSDIRNLWYHRECGNCGETLRVKHDGICDCYIGDEWCGPGCYICQRVTDRDTCLDFCGHCYQTKEGRVRCRECPHYYIREYWGITRDEISERSQHVWPHFEL